MGMNGLCTKSMWARENQTVQSNVESSPIVHYLGGKPILFFYGMYFYRLLIITLKSLLHVKHC